jgi:hypothetical protein
MARSLVINLPDFLGELVNKLLTDLHLKGLSEEAVMEEFDALSELWPHKKDRLEALSVLVNKA